MKKLATLILIVFLLSGCQNGELKPCLLHEYLDEFGVEKEDSKQLFKAIFNQLKKYQSNGDPYVFIPQTVFVVSPEE